MSKRLAQAVYFVALILAISSATARAADLDMAVLSHKTPGDIQWRESLTVPGNRQAILYGDPSKPGPYVVRNWFKAGNFSRPHFHPNDRFIVVLSGT